MTSTIAIMRAKLAEYATYRLTFLLWRVRNVFQLLLIYFIWDAALKGDVAIAGYTQATIFSYIFLANIIGAIVLSSKTDQVAADILSGAIMNQILRPMNFFGYLGAKETADKLVNTGFAILEAATFILILQPPLQLSVTPAAIGLMAVFLLGAIGLSFGVSLALSMIAFWTPETWAPRFIFMVLISLSAGTMFPIDILPEPLYTIAMMTPFPYLVYVPVKALIFGATPEMGGYAVILGGWLIGISLICTFVWNKGMREFSFFGR